jgi:hypothetical protein
MDQHDGDATLYAAGRADQLLDEGDTAGTASCRMTGSWPRWRSCGGTGGRARGELKPENT